jgi:hypothetical protein
LDGVAFSADGIGVLVHISDGYYYAELIQAAVNIDHGIILGRYKSANTREAKGINAIEVGGPRNALARLVNDIHIGADGVITFYNRAGHAGGAGEVLFTLTPSRYAENERLLTHGDPA